MLASRVSLPTGACAEGRTGKRFGGARRVPRVSPVVQFSFPTRIRFGPGASGEVRTHLESQRKGRPLVVTDAGLAKLPMFAAFRASLLPALSKVIYLHRLYLVGWLQTEYS